jgi:hypothetical protein
MRWEQERLAEVEQEVRQAASGNAAFAWSAFLAFACCRFGYDDEARRELEWLDSDGFDHLPRYDGWMIGMTFLAETCVHLGEHERGARVYELLLPFADRNVTVSQTVFAGPAARFLGLLAGARGEWDVAAGHFQSAREAAQRMQAPVPLLKADIEEARMLARRDGAGDRDRALELLGSSRQAAESLDLGGIVRAIDELRERIAQVEKPPAPPFEVPRASPAIASLRREGDVWAFELGSQSVRLRDSKGMRCLAVLLANPGVEIHAVELSRETTDPEGRESGARAAAARAELGGAGSDDAGPLLDAEAKAAYRRRLDELREEVEEAESFNDPERAARAREEMDFLVRELAGAVGLRGRDRKAASSAERARVSVTKAIRSTLRRVREHDANLGRELEATVKTGTFCVYEPDPRHPLDWRVDAG